MKFSLPGTTVNVLVERKDDLVLLTVTDHGIGIPESDLAHMFIPYKRLSVKPTAGESSNGLGLCIVKSIVEVTRYY